MSLFRNNSCLGLFFAVTLLGWTSSANSFGQTPLYWIGLPNSGGIGATEPQWDSNSGWTTNPTGAPPATSVKPNSSTAAIIGNIQNLPDSGPAISTTINFWGTGTERTGSVEFRGTQSFTFAPSQFVTEVSSLTLSSGTDGFVNNSTGDHNINIDVVFTGVETASISNADAGSLTFARQISAPAMLGIGISQGSMTFSSIESTNLDIAHTGGNLTFGEAVTIATGDSLSVAGSGEINFNGGLAFDSGGRFTWDLNSTAEINASEIDFGGNFVTELDLTGYNSLEDLEGLQLDIFNSVADIEALPANFSFTFINNNGIDGIDSDLFTWQITNNGNTLTLVSLAAVPEPSTIVLLGVAGAIGGVVARRRKKMATNDQAEEAVVA